MCREESAQASRWPICLEPVYQCFGGWQAQIGHKGARRAATLRLAGMLQQPLRERRFSAVKLFQSVRRPQRLGGQNVHLPAQTGCRENKWANPELSDSGRSSMSRSAWYWLPETMKRR